MIPAAFIAGTDTEVGKTVITCALLRMLIDSGHTAIGMKPVASGAERTITGLRNDDALQLIENSKPQLSYSVINPCVYLDPTSPDIAAARMGSEVELSVIDVAYQKCRAAAEIVLVEGIGGWRVPLSGTLQTVDLVRYLNLPVILVCGIRLGGINHALLSAEAIIADSDAKADRWLKLNTDFALKWPNITRKGTPPPDAEAHKDEPGKFDKYFSPEPGKGA